MVYGVQAGKASTAHRWLTKREARNSGHAEYKTFMVIQTPLSLGPTRSFVQEYPSLKAYDTSDVAGVYNNPKVTPAFDVNRSSAMKSREESHVKPLCYRSTFTPDRVDRIKEG